jgi:ATP-dependent Clp protease ATP-binding subunit ClpA
LHFLQQLIGDTSGNPGILTSAIRQNPYGVLLLDEIEKANMDVLNVFLTMLDEAYFSDGEGKRVDCRNLIIVATSNAGADLVPGSGSIVDLVLQKGIFTPEFINRFDGVIAFDSLSNDEIKEVALKMLVKIHEDIKSKHNIDLQVTPQFLDSIIQKGYNPRFGARNMAHIIQDEIENKLAQVILEQKVVSGQVVTF